MAYNRQIMLNILEKYLIIVNYLGYAPNPYGPPPPQNPYAPPQYPTTTAGPNVIINNTYPQQETYILSISSVYQHWLKTLDNI